MTKKKETKRKENKRDTQKVNSDTESNNIAEKNEKETETKLTTEDLLKLEKDKNLRLVAEFDNFRKRTAKERIELFSSANKDIMSVLLPVLDNFERSIKANNYSDEDGPVLIYKQLKSELEKKGLKEIDDPVGKKLDTDFHEATANAPVTAKKEKGKIVSVIEKGYLLGEKVIRYTKVVVGN